MGGTKSKVLGFVNTSLSREVLGHVATCTTAIAVWKELTAMFSSQSRARTIQMRPHLATTRKGDQTATVYYNKMKGFAYELFAAGKPLEDEDFTSYVLVGLDQDYNSFVENMIGKTEISLGVLYSQFLAIEARLELQSSQYQSSANSTTCGRGSYPREMAVAVAASAMVLVDVAKLARALE
jgi:hypothetical protein